MTLASRIEKVIELPEGVQVDIAGSKITVKGQSTLERDFKTDKVMVEKKDNTIVVFAEFPRKKEKALVGTVAAHITNMINGVTKGFEYKLVVFYSHFPINVKVEGKEVLINNFLGEKFPRKANIVRDAKVDVKGQDITVSGVDKEDVAQTAANLVENTGIGRRDPRVFKDGIFVSSKGVKE